MPLNNQKGVKEYLFKYMAFGGKIWSNLHRVSPDNNLDKNSNLRTSINCLPSSYLTLSNMKYCNCSDFSCFGCFVRSRVCLQFSWPVSSKCKIQSLISFQWFSLPKLVLKIMLWLLKKLFVRVDKQNHLTPDFHFKLCILLNLYTTKNWRKKSGTCILILK